MVADYHNFRRRGCRQVPGEDQLDEYGDCAKEASGSVAD